MIKKSILNLTTIFFITGCTTGLSVNKNDFRRKKWTEWYSERSELSIYVSGGIYGLFTSGIAYDNQTKTYYKAEFSLDEYRDPNADYLKLSTVENGITLDKKISLSKNKDRKIEANFGSEGKTVLESQNIFDSKLDARLLYYCKLESLNDDITFNSTIGENFSKDGTTFESKRGASSISILFKNNNNFDITFSNEKITGTYNISHTILTLHFEKTNTIFESNVVDFNILFYDTNLKWSKCN